MEICKEMIVKARSAYSAMRDHQEKLAKAEKEGAKGTEERKRALIELKEAEIKRKKLEEELELVKNRIISSKKKAINRP